MVRKPSCKAGLGEGTNILKSEVSCPQDQPSFAGDNRDGSGPVGSCHDPSVCSSSCFEFPLHSNAGVKKEGSAER